MRWIGVLLLLLGLALLGSVATGWIAWSLPVSDESTPAGTATSIAERMLAAGLGGVIATLAGLIVLLRGRAGRGSAGH